MPIAPVNSGLTTPFLNVSSPEAVCTRVLAHTHGGTRMLCAHPEHCRGAQRYTRAHTRVHTRPSHVHAPRDTQSQSRPGVPGKQPKSGRPCPPARPTPAPEEELAGDTGTPGHTVPRSPCSPVTLLGCHPAPVAARPAETGRQLWAPGPGRMIYSLSMAHEKLPELKTFIFCC